MDRNHTSTLDPNSTIWEEFVTVILSYYYKDTNRLKKLFLSVIKINVPEKIREGVWLSKEGGMAIKKGGYGY